MARQAIQDMKASLVTTGLTNSKLSTPIVPSPTGFSFGLWLKPWMIGNPTYHYFGYGSTAFTDGVILFRGAGKSNLELNIYNAGVNICGLNSTSNAASKNDWIHVAGTYLPSGTCNLYCNGSLKQTVTSTGTMSVPAAQTLAFGNRSYADAPTGGVFSSIVWHNTTTPWTDQQVLDLYNKGTIPTGATAVYPLDEGAGSIAYDTSGNGNDGTITSGTWTRDTPTKTRKLVNNNLVYNGDFEIAPVVNVATTTAARWIDGTAAGSTTNNIFGWGVVTKTGTAEAIFDSTSPSSGTESMKVSTTATASKIEVGSNGIDTAANNRLSCISVLPSTSYTLTFRMKTQLNSGTATGGARVGINTFTGAGTYVTTPVLTTAIKTTTDWTTYTSTFTTGATVRLLAVYLIVDGSGGTTGLTLTGGPITASGTLTLGGTLGVANGGTGAATLTGYVKGSGTSVMTASATIPTTDLSGTISNAQLANSAITINGTSTNLGGSISVGTVTSVTGTAPVVSSGGATPARNTGGGSTLDRLRAARNALP